MFSATFQRGCDREQRDSQELAHLLHSPLALRRLKITLPSLSSIDPASQKALVASLLPSCSAVPALHVLEIFLPSLAALAPSKPPGSHSATPLSHMRRDPTQIPHLPREASAFEPHGQTSAISQHDSPLSASFIFLSMVLSHFAVMIQ